MRNIISILAFIIVAFITTGCAQPTAQTGNNQDDQRARSRQAQDELSAAVHK